MFIMLSLVMFSSSSPRLLRFRIRFLLKMNSVESRRPFVSVVPSLEPLTISAHRWSYLGRSERANGGRPCDEIVMSLSCKRL